MQRLEAAGAQLDEASAIALLRKFLRVFAPAFPSMPMPSDQDWARATGDRVSPAETVAQSPTPGDLARLALAYRTITLI